MVIYLEVFKEPHYDVSNIYEQIIVFHITSICLHHSKI